MAINDRSGTQDIDYSKRLQKRGSVWWKRLICAQAPYRWNIRRLVRGFVLDLGCGIGRNLAHLDGRGVGVDHNPHSVKIARSAGLRAFTPDEFLTTSYNSPGSFDAMLLAHVVEHMALDQAADLIKRYLPLIRKFGRVIIICPQEAGYRSDRTHVKFLGFQELRALAQTVGLAIETEYSFPFPRFAGRFFLHNEFIVVTQKTA